ncbi:MAG: hypothetical protein V3V08_08110 [Nannocystaceae bacterium]
MQGLAIREGLVEVLVGPLGHVPLAAGLDVVEDVLESIALRGCAQSELGHAGRKDDVIVVEARGVVEHGLALPALEVVEGHATLHVGAQAVDFTHAELGQDVLDLVVEGAHDRDAGDVLASGRVPLPRKIGVRCRDGIVALGDVHFGDVEELPLLDDALLITVMVGLLTGSEIRSKPCRR